MHEQCQTVIVQAADLGALRRNQLSNNDLELIGIMPWYAESTVLDAFFSALQEPQNGWLTRSDARLPFTELGMRKPLPDLGSSRQIAQIKQTFAALAAKNTLEPTNGGLKVEEPGKQL